MKGETITLLDFLEPSRTRFIIPLYQRNYDWKEEHCRQLLTDVERIYREHVESHFFGSIVTRIADMSSKDILIIDGQQRITTVTLLMAALIRAYQDKKITCTDISKYEILWEDYIYEKHFSGRHYKLQPIEKDRIALDAILDNKELIENSHITTNYRLFCDWIANCNLTLDDIYDALCKLVIIDIRLGKDDDPQLIFESINSTGLELSEADKIRNYFLMSLSALEQEKYYKEYWNPIEEYTNYAPTMFIRDYLTLQQRKIGKIENLYRDFKLYVQQNSLNRYEVLKDMLSYAKEWHKVISLTTGDKLINSKLKELRTLNSTVDMPFYMAFLHYATEHNLANSYIYDVLNIIENYWARRIICGLPANALSKVFCTLHADVVDIIKQQSDNFNSCVDYIDVLIYILLRKQGTSIFPRDTMVREKFKIRQIYFIPTEYRYFLFERMENRNGKEFLDVVQGMRDGKITIEHIMPQTLTTWWRKELGDNAEEIHDKYLHTFANLTLTGYNSNYSNRSFSEKKTGYIDKDENEICGYDKSAYRLSSYLKTIQHWTEKEIVSRGNILCKDFLKLFPEPKTTFKEQNIFDKIAFDPEDKNAFVGRKIYAYTYKSDTYPANSWRDMLIGVCTIVYKEDPFKVTELCKSQHSSYLHYTSDKTNDYVQIGSGCVVDVSTGNYAKMTTLQSLFDSCNIDYSDLVFTLYPQTEDKNSE